MLTQKSISFNNKCKYKHKHKHFKMKNKFKYKLVKEKSEIISLSKFPMNNRQMNRLMKVLIFFIYYNNIKMLIITKNYHSAVMRINLFHGYKECQSKNKQKLAVLDNFVIPLFFLLSLLA